MSSSLERRGVPLAVRPVRIRRPGDTFHTPWWHHRGFSLAVDLLIGLALFALSFSVNLDHVETTGFHADETRWLNRAYFIEELTDPYGSTWQDYYLTRGQPPLGSYIIGIGQWIQGTSMQPNLVWDFFYSSTNWNDIAGAMPDDENLESGRRTSAFIGALAVMSAYFVTRRLTNPTGGIVAALLITWHRLNWGIGSQALSDQTLLLTLGLIFLAAFQFMKRPTWGWAILLGVMFGLGGSAKLTPLLLGFVAMGMGFLLLLRWLVYPLSRADKRIDRDMAIKLISQPFIAFAAFVLVYPYLWVAPIRRTWNLFDFRIQEMESQGRVLGNAKVEGLVDSFLRISNQIGGSRQTSNQFYIWINEWFDQDWKVIVGLDLAVACVGILFVISLAVRSGVRSPQFLVTSLLGAEAAIIIIGLRSDLYRYYLPIVFIMFICVGVMVGMITKHLSSIRFRRQTTLSPEIVRTTHPSTLTGRIVKRRRPANIPPSRHLKRP